MSREDRPKSREFDSSYLFHEGCAMGIEEMKPLPQVRRP